MINSATRKKRLEEAIRVLESLGEEERQLDMGNWRKCDMISCVGGWIAADPWFRKQGMTASEADGSPVYKNGNGAIDVSQFFGIPYGAMEYLFMPISYRRRDRRDERVVAARFKQFAKDGKYPDME